MSVRTGLGYGDQLSGKDAGRGETLSCFALLPSASMTATAATRAGMFIVGNLR